MSTYRSSCSCRRRTVRRTPAQYPRSALAKWAAREWIGGLRGGMVLITLCVFAAKPRMARLASPSPRVSWAHPDSSGLRADQISNVERLVSALVSAGTRKLPLQLPRTSVAWPVAKTLREPCRPKRDNHHLQGVSRLERQLSSLQRHRLTRILRASCASRH